MLQTLAQIYLVLFAALRLPGMSPYKVKPEIDIRHPGAVLSVVAAVAGLTVLIAMAFGA